MDPWTRGHCFQFYYPTCHKLYSVERLLSFVTELLHISIISLPCVLLTVTFIILLRCVGTIRKLTLPIKLILIWNRNRFGQNYRLTQNNNTLLSMIQYGHNMLSKNSMSFHIWSFPKAFLHRRWRSENGSSLLCTFWPAGGSRAHTASRNEASSHQHSSRSWQELADGFYLTCKRLSAVNNHQNSPEFKDDPPSCTKTSHFWAKNEYFLLSLLTLL